MKKTLLMTAAAVTMTIVSAFGADKMTLQQQCYRLALEEGLDLSAIPVGIDVQYIQQASESMTNVEVAAWWHQNKDRLGREASYIKHIFANRKFQIVDLLKKGLDPRNLESFEIFTVIWFSEYGDALLPIGKSKTDLTATDDDCRSKALSFLSGVMKNKNSSLKGLKFFLKSKDDINEVEGLAYSLPGSLIESIVFSDFDCGINWTIEDYSNAKNFWCKAIKALAKSLRESQVAHFEIRYGTFGDDGAIDIAQGLPGSKVKKLILVQNGIGKIGAGAIFCALLESQVEYLDLQGNVGIGFAGLQALDAATTGTQLEHLDLSGCRIGSAGAQTLASALAGSKIKELILVRNKIRDEGVLAIANALRESQVEYLVLRENQIGDEGAQALANGLLGSKVQTLDLEENKVGTIQRDNLITQFPNVKFRF